MPVCTHTSTHLLWMDAFYQNRFYTRSTNGNDWMNRQIDVTICVCENGNSIVTEHFNVICSIAFYWMTLFLVAHFYVISWLIKYTDAPLYYQAQIEIIKLGLKTGAHKQLNRKMVVKLIY